MRSSHDECGTDAKGQHSLAHVDKAVPRLASLMSMEQKLIVSVQDQLLLGDVVNRNLKRRTARVVVDRHGRKSGENKKLGRAHVPIEPSVFDLVQPPGNFCQTARESEKVRTSSGLSFVQLRSRASM